MTTLTLPTAQSFSNYLTYAYSVPNLTLDEEQTLARRYRDEGDLAAAQQLVLSHLKLVVSVARGYDGYGLPQEDLVQEGTVGLMQAVKKFDPDRGVRLVSHALYWIKAAIQEYVVRNWRLVKIATTKAQRKLFFNLRSLKKTLQPLTHVQAEEIAQQLNVSKQDVLEMDARFSRVEISTSTPRWPDDDQETLEATLVDDEAYQPEALLIEAETSNERQALSAALAQLDPRSLHVLKSRVLCEPEQVRTLHDLAVELGISHERVRQIEQAALKKLKKIVFQ